MNQNQANLFDIAQSDTSDHAPRAVVGRPKFVEPRADEIFMGARPLRQYLLESGQRKILDLADALRSLEWSEFEERYTGAGRPGYAPRLMVGLVMYGLVKGVSSLRGLEDLSRMDLGCMWVCAGIQPDHSNIGRFLLRHQAEFEGTFFEQVAQAALKATGSGVDDLAGDGTTIEAAASRYGTIKREALDRKLADTSLAKEASPDDPDKTAEHSKYSAADRALRERETKRRAKGYRTNSLRVSPAEPEAVVQRLKNRSFALSYKPSVLANKERVVVGADVHPSDESAVIDKMLDQAESVGGESVKRLRLDGGYCNQTILETSIKRDIDLLCPVPFGARKPGSKFKKVDFRYDEANDLYICPAGQQLTRRGHGKSVQGNFVRYETHGCANCPLRSQCTKAKTPRRLIRRYPVDDAKDALQMVMKQPRARTRYAERKAMVEPVFSYLRGVMSLRRFRRVGLERVRLEFFLNTAAYNLSRLWAALDRSEAVVALWRRLRRCGSWIQLTTIIIRVR